MDIRRDYLELELTWKVWDVSLPKVEYAGARELGKEVETVKRELLSRRGREVNGEAVCKGRREGGIGGSSGEEGNQQL